MTPDLADMFSRRVGEHELAHVLDLLAKQPNPRERALPGDLPGQFDYWFDGGACRVQTGWKEFEFLDGTVAELGSPIPALYLKVTFPNGRRVLVQQESFGLDEDAL